MGGDLRSEGPSPAVVEKLDGVEECNGGNWTCEGCGRGTVGGGGGIGICIAGGFPVIRFPVG